MNLPYQIEGLKLQCFQARLSRAFIANTQVMDSVTQFIMLALMSNTVTMLAQTNSEINNAHKDLWRSEFLADKARSLCSANRPVTDSLFGADFTERLKS